MDRQFELQPGAGCPSNVARDTLLTASRSIVATRWPGFRRPMATCNATVDLPELGLLVPWYEPKLTASR